MPRRKRDPHLPTNIYRRDSRVGRPPRYFGMIRVNGRYLYTGSWNSVAEVEHALAGLPERRPRPHISISWHSDRLARPWRLRLGAERRSGGYFATWDDAWAAVKSIR
jgi:hypothetical protein